MSIQSIAAEIQAMIDEARREAFREGWEAMKASILNAEPPSPETAKVSVAEQVKEVEEDEGALQSKERRYVRRAPRGLTNRVLKRLLLEHGMGMTMDNAQARAVAADPRISAKTVYNELYRENDFYRDNTGRWRLTNQEAAREELRNAPEERETGEAPTAH